MRSYYTGRRRRRLRSGSALLLILLLMLLLVSCVAGSNALIMNGWLGTDLSKYRAEPTLALLSLDDPVAAELCSSVELLCTDTVELPEFQNAGQAVRRCRDRILNGMLRSNFSLYVGNVQLSSAVAKSYPNLSAAVLIPQADFENTVTRHFGASGVSNADGEYFSYLSDSDCYMTPSHGRVMTVSITVLQLEETESCYRMQLCLQDTAGNQKSYSAIFVKRSDATAPAYLRALSPLK